MFGRATQVTDTQGDVTSTTFNKAGQPITTTDAKGKVTNIVYDARGRKKTVTDRLAGVTSFAYDAASNLLSMTDAEGQVTSYTYDNRGAKTQEQYPDHVNGAAVGTANYGLVLFTFDPAGRVKRKGDHRYFIHPI
jgi:YD repeat-containing protein